MMLLPLEVCRFLIIMEPSLLIRYSYLHCPSPQTHTFNLLILYSQKMSLCTQYIFKSNDNILDINNCIVYVYIHM